MTYWDTSAIVKLYATEADSEYLLDLALKNGAPLVSSAIAATEILATLFRKEHAGDVNPGAANPLFRRFRADCERGGVRLISYGDDVIEEATRLIALAFAAAHPVLVRSLDLIHLASARVAHTEAVVSTDQRLRSLGLHLGFRLIP